MHHGVKNVMGIFISQLALYPEHIVGQGVAVWEGAGRTGTRQVLQLLLRCAPQLGEVWTQTNRCLLRAS